MNSMNNTADMKLVIHNHYYPTTFARKIKEQKHIKVPCKHEAKDKYKKVLDKSANGGIISEKHRYVLYKNA